MNSLNALFFPPAPDSPPSDISSVSSPYGLIIHWDTPSHPSGVITQYTLYIDYRNGSEIVQVTFNSAVHWFNFTGLSPYQTVLVAMSASTGVGEGVRSGYIAYTTQETGVCVCVPYLSCWVFIVRNDLLSTNYSCAELHGV